MYEGLITTNDLTQVVSKIQELRVADKSNVIGHTLVKSSNFTEYFVDANGHDYVEIGGLLWATKNIGAEDITDTGLYFQWGDIQGYTAEQVGSGEGQKYFGWEDYKYNDGTSSPTASNMTKYNNTDGKTTLDLSDDGVNAAWGGNWRMPTLEEFVALGAAVNTVWTSDYQGTGVAGLVCTDKTDSSKVLFFPAVSFCGNGSVSTVGSNGFYWSSSVNSSSVQYAYGLGFNNYATTWQSNNRRMGGFSVRGVLYPSLTTDSIQQLTENQNKLYPQTLSEAVLCKYGKTLEEVLIELNNRITALEQTIQNQT